VGCDVGEGCGVVIVSGRDVRFVVGGKNVGFIAHCLWTPVLLLVVLMVSLWWVVRPGGRAESAHRLRNLMVVQTVPLGRGWYLFAWREPGTV